MFLTPIIYPSSLLSPDLRLISSLNPLTSVIEGFRMALLGVEWEVGQARRHQHIGARRLERLKPLYRVVEVGIAT